MEDLYSTSSLNPSLALFQAKLRLKGLDDNLEFEPEGQDKHSKGQKFDL